MSSSSQPLNWLLQLSLIDAGFHYSLESGASIRSVYDFRVDSPFEQLQLFIDGKHPDYPFDIETASDTFKFGLPRFVFFSKFLNLDRETLIQKSKALGMNSASSAEVKEDLVTYRIFQPYRIPLQTQSVFKVESQFPATDPFWRVVRSVKKFSEKHKRLPLYASIPDVFSDSKPFQVLVKIFADQSNIEWDEIRSDVPDVSPELISTIAKSIYNLNAFVYEPISIIKNQASSVLSYLFIAARHFFDQNNRDPTDREEDIQYLISEMKTLGCKASNIEETVIYLLRLKG